MNFISVTEYAERYGLNARTVRNYCCQGKLNGAFLTGKTWNIPEDAVVSKAKKIKESALLRTLRRPTRRNSACRNERSKSVLWATKIQSESNS